MTKQTITAVLAGVMLIGTAAGARAAVIGPDTYGYTATNNIPYTFTDISGSGTQVLTNDDDSAVAAALGFGFDFYGTGYTSLFISSNGLMTFNTANSAFTNAALSGSQSPDVPMIAPLWDDWVTLDANGADAVYYQMLGAPGSRQFITQWNNVVSFGGSPSTVTFQSILFEGSNNILFNYADVISGDGKNNGGSATVGIRNTSGNTNGQNLQWSFNQPLIQDQESILFTAAPTAVPEPGTLFLLGSGVMGLVARARARKQRVN
jgi:hypothetical protein